MPNRSAKACLTHGCRVLVRGSGSRCPEHARAKESARGSSTSRGYNAEWRRLRGAHLSAHPMCSHPACDLIATDVDHVTPHRGDDRLRLDPDNLQSLCHGHHSSKTVAQDGGLGHARETISVGHIWTALRKQIELEHDLAVASSDEEWEPTL